MTVALYETEEDKRRGYRRSSHVRFLPPANPSCSDFYTTMRNTSESYNSQIQDRLYRCRRARSVGWKRVQADMFGLATLVNALTRERLLRACLSQAA